MARDVRDTARQALFTRRAAMASIGASGLFGAVFWRLYSLQVEQAEEFGNLAEENRVNVRLLVPQRGRILDRFGVELAANRQNFRVLLVPEDARNQGVTSVEEALNLLSEIVDLSDYRRRRALRDAARNRAFVPITVKENLDWEEFARVNVNLPDLPGIVPDVGQTRYYPIGSHVAHIVGHVGRVTEEEQQEDNDPLLRLPDFRIGKLGVERELEDRLRGAAGTSQVVVNAVGRVIRERQRIEGQPGDDVVLTIDEELQRHAAAQFECESGAAAVIDVESGDILALVSEPGFDPNLFTFGISETDWAALRDNDLNPMVNKAVSGQYPPGSTFKMAVALAALEAGVMPPREQIFCSGHITFGDRDFHCWRRRGHGAMNMRDAIKHSCDVYFYEAARRIGVDAIAAMAERLGLGRRTGIPVPGERDGLVPNTGWKIGTLGERWQQGETLIAGIGQGYLLTTPLQLALMTARLARGAEVIPRLVRARGAGDEDIVADPPLPQMPLGFDPAHLAIVHDGMNAVVNEAGGTATRSAVTGTGMSMAGKTGTAQVRNISAAERESGVLDNDELPRHLRDHALFVGFGPVEAPRYAVAVIVEHGSSGSRAAGPRAREIMQFALERDPGRRPALGELVQSTRADGEPG
jgi:penicillin-binding protein 2